MRGRSTIQSIQEDNNAYCRRDCELCEHVQPDVHETSMQEDRSDESANDGYRPKSGVIARLPPPLIGLFTMEATMTTNILDGTKSIRWVSGVVKTWQSSAWAVQLKAETNSHGIFNVAGTSRTSFMHGGKRAPTRIRALPEGPNIGLTTGCMEIKTEHPPVKPRRLTHVERNRATLRLSIHHQFVNKNSNHDNCERPDYKDVKLECNA
jgi:hypothetical protein